MSLPESDSKVFTEDEDEEEQIYQWIYGMMTTYDKQENEEDQILPSSGPSPVHLKNNAEGGDSEDEATHNTTQGDNTMGSDMDALNNIQQIPVLKAKVEEKPWMRPGADISDYFNYGFDEESWKTYCKKQYSQKLYTQITVEKWKNIHGKKDSCSAYASSDSQPTHASRQSSAALDVIGERPGPSSRVEGHPCRRVKGNNTRVVTTMSPEEDRITSNDLPLPSKVNSLFAYTTAPAFFYRQRPPPSFSHATFDSGYSKDFDKPSTATPSGVPSLIPGGISYGVIETAKAWECYIRQEMCDRYRGRTRQYGHDKESKRGRERDREDCSFSYNSREKHMRPRDTTERGHKHPTFVRFNGREEEWQGERRHRDKRGEPKSSCSSRSKSNGGEDRDSQSRHKNKKAKRNRKDKGTSKVSSAEQERKLKCD